MSFVWNSSAPTDRAQHPVGIKRISAVHAKIANRRDFLHAESTKIYQGIRARRCRQRD
jgi:hypothetical protein